MNERNLEYLSNQLKYSGFGEGHAQELKDKVNAKPDEFTLFHQQDFGKDNIVASLHFNKSKEGDLYFFNRFSLVLKNAEHPDAIKQTFFINNDMQRKEHENITLKEGYNLMSGRAVFKQLVNKSGEKYSAWLQLNFKETDPKGNYLVKQFHENYGFNIGKVLAKHPVKELAIEDQKTRLIESLQRGNRQLVTLQLNNQERKVAIEASPQFKSINFYEPTGQRVKTEDLSKGNTEGQTTKQQTMKESQAKSGDEEGESGPPAQKKRRNRQSIS